MARRPKIDSLPADLKTQLERLLLDKTHGGYMALSAWLKEQGFEISHAAVHRYDQRLQNVMSRIKASTEAARLIAQSAPDEADEHSAAVLRMVQSSLFEAMTRVTEAQDADPADQVKILSQAARAIAEASRASIGQKKWADEVKTKLDAIEREAGRAGRTLDAETLRAVREGLYGG
ncbi:phage protein Gp27 family protein [Gulbenkiania mobilis]|uniref:Uncharacterized protein DUF3486 n=1 Tax=Gulbenkiania mobilis TaxID=397457 RepID=A0ABY2CW53_GULMO|nr:uncharacterized protein DUF3486 [Gulbenkiania mobilis]